MNVGVLTSSRADYSIYLPLLRAIKTDSFFSLSLIAFGTHLSEQHGYTKNAIIKDGFKVDYELNTLPTGDQPFHIASSIGKTIELFSSFWNEKGNSFDLIFCLGDRYEMFAAVTAGIPFNMKFAHLHGGEKTLGSIDNVFRHCITHASFYHFASTLHYAERIKSLLDEPKNIYYVGALSLDNLENLQLFSKKEFYKLYNYDISFPTILVTFHPETVGFSKNSDYIKVILEILLSLSTFRILITSSNADTMRDVFWKEFKELEKQSGGKIKCIENLGTQGYFSAMKHCSFLLGNSSSSIIEAASFDKMVINVGNRQKGRIHGDNVIDVSFNKAEILQAIQKANNTHEKYVNPYYSGNVARRIVQILKSDFIK